MKVESPYKVGVGILSMQERVKLIGGQFDISRTSRGTTVTVRLPYHLSTTEDEPFVFTPSGARGVL